MKLSKSSKSGSVLLLTLLVVSLLLVLVLSFVVTVRMGLREMTNYQDMVIARQNARLGMELAISQLQQYAGADQRVTARADILEGTAPGRMLLTGVWDSQAEINGVANPRFGSILGLLTSGAEAYTAGDGYLQTDPSINPADTIELVRAHPDFAAVRVEMRNLPRSGSQTADGRYAWWVADESVKARLNLASDPDFTEDGKHRKFRSPMRTGVHTLDIFSEALTLDPEVLISWLGRIISRRQLSFLLDTTDPIAAEHFHDLTDASKGLLTDARNGGLKRDLTTAFQYDEIFNRDFANQPDRNDLIPRNLPEFEPPGGNTFIGVPTLSILRDYYALKNVASPEEDRPYEIYRQLYRSPTSYGSGSGRRHSYNLGWFHGPSSYWEPTETEYPRNSPVTPVVAKYQFGFGFEYDFQISEGVLINRRTLLTIHPQFELYNPYSVTLLQHPGEHWRHQTKPPRPLITVTREPADGGPPLSATFRLSELFFNPNMQGVNWNVGLRLEHAPGTQIVDLGPGERRVFVPATSLTTVTPNFNGWRHLTSNYDPNAAWRMLIDRDHIQSNVNYTANASSPGPTALFQMQEQSVYEDVDNRFTDSEDEVAKFGLTEAEARVFQADSPNDLITIQVIFDEETLASIPKDFGLVLFNGFETDGKDVFMQRYGHIANPKAFATEFSTTKRAADWTGDIEFAFSLSLRKHSETADLADQGKNLDTETLSSVTRATNRNLVDSNVRSFAPTALSEGLPQGGISGSELMPAASSYTMTTTSGNIAADKMFVMLAPSQPTARGSVMVDNDLGIATLPLFDVLRMEVTALAQFQHAMVSFFSHHPSYAVGNSYAPIRMPLNRTIFSPQSGTVFDDLSYYVNRSLYDRYFLSTLPEEEDEFLQVLAGNPVQANRRIQPIPEVLSAAPIASDMLNPASSDSYETLAARLYVDGPFNVNSTSVQAWKAVLSSLANTPVPLSNSTDSVLPAEFEAVDGVYFSRFERPFGEEFTQGVRVLSETELEALAERIVAEVRARGPFLSMADFVNRDPSSAERDHQLMGALQAALDATINQNTSFIPETPALETIEGFFENFDGPDGLPGSQNAGMPGWLLQADVLQSLDSILTVRGDTFLIRSYGEKSDPVTGRIQARSWCEAVVQRVPAAVTYDGGPPTVEDLKNPPTPFGRRFHLVSFRWVNPEEL